MTLQHDIYKREFLEAVKKDNQMRKEKVKTEEELRLEKLKMIDDQKKQNNQEFYQNRVEEEKQRILDREKKIRKMEKMEAELLGRLKNSQQLEQSEYSKLEQALKESNEASEQRKKNRVMIRKPRPKELQKMRNSASAQETNSNSNI